MPDRYITMKTLLTMIPFSRQHVYNLMRKNEFPQSIKLGERRVAWRQVDVEAWIKWKETGESPWAMTTDATGLPRPVHPLRRKRAK